MIDVVLTDLLPSYNAMNTWHLQGHDCVSSLGRQQHFGSRMTYDTPATTPRFICFISRRRGHSREGRAARPDRNAQPRQTWCWPDGYGCSSRSAQKFIYAPGWDFGEEQPHDARLESFYNKFLDDPVCSGNTGE